MPHKDSDWLVYSYNYLVCYNAINFLFVDCIGYGKILGLEISVKHDLKSGEKA